MLTTIQAKEVLEGRGIVAPYQTLVRWVRGGLFAGAVLDETHPRGALWLIPAASVEGFQPPKKGRPEKPVETKQPRKRKGA